jgi:hypothetical protein
MATGNSEEWQGFGVCKSDLTYMSMEKLAIVIGTFTYCLLNVLIRCGLDNRTVRRCSSSADLPSGIDAGPGRMIDASGDNRGPSSAVTLTFGEKKYPSGVCFPKRTLRRPPPKLQVVRPLPFQTREGYSKPRHGDYHIFDCTDSLCNACEYFCVERSSATRKHGRTTSGTDRRQAIDRRAAVYAENPSGW